MLMTNRSAAARVQAQASPVGFVVDRMALGYFFLRVLRFSPVNIIPPLLFIYYIRDGQRAQ
jgi:hypothetical protein